MTVGTAGANGTGVNVTPALSLPHATNTIVSDQNTTAINVAANSFVHTCIRNFRNETRVAWSDHALAGRSERARQHVLCRRRPGRERYLAGIRRDAVHRRPVAGGDTVPDAFGPPNPEITQNWAATRYIPWTSWRSAATVWPSASGNSSTEGEGSGMAVYAHELTPQPRSLATTTTIRTSRRSSEPRPATGA